MKQKFSRSVVGIIVIMVGFSFYAVIPIMVGNAFLPDWSVEWAYYIVVVIMLYSLAVLALASPHHRY